MWKKKFIIFLMANTFVFSSLAIRYKVVEGDTLSKIVLKNTSSPQHIYGPNGRIAEVLKINPQIKKPSYILPGQIINLDIGKEKKERELNILQKRSISSIEEVEKNELIAPEVKKKLNLKYNIQNFYASLYTGISSISSVDSSTGQVEKSVSNIGHGVDIKWSHFWTDKIIFSFNSSYKKYKFTMGKNRVLSNHSISKFAIGSDLEYMFSKMNNFSFFVRAREHLILESLSQQSSFSLSKVTIFEVGPSGKHKLIDFLSGYSLIFNWKVGSLLPSSQSDYKTKLGYFYDLGLGSRYDYDGTILNIESFYKKSNLEVGTAEQTSKELGFKVGIGWDF